MKRMILVAGVLIILLIVFVIIMFAVNSGMNNPSPKGKVILKGHEIEVYVADNLMTRERGLSGHEPLGENQGMLFLFGYPSAQSFWMKDMKFPLDIVFIRDHKIVEIAENLPAPANMFDIASVTSANLIDSALEVNAGTAKRLGWQPGDEVLWEINKDKTGEDVRVNP